MNYVLYHPCPLPNTQTCREKVGALLGRNQFTLDDRTSQCTKQTRTGQDWYVCQGDMDFSTARERWWFVVLTRCDPPVNSTFKGMYLHYRLHMTNGDGLLQKEFSADEFYILVIDIVFFILYIILLVIAISCAVVLTQRKLLHTTYKMFLCALSIWSLHLLLMVIAWGYYGTTGWEIRPAEVMGRILQTCSNIVFILMLILLAKGYTVVRVRLTTKAIIKITIFINLYIVAMVVMFIWEGALFDPGLVLYYYESPPGYGMITVILIGWLWFTKAAVFTLKHYSKKTIFYVAFYTFYTIWFWASPFVVLIAMFAMAKWTREKTVNGVQQFIAFLAHTVFLILTLPHKANENFPYHIRTTQIGSMNDGSEYSEPNNSYENTFGDSFTGVGPNLDIFITSRSYSEGGNGQNSYIPLETSSTGSSVSILSRMQQGTQPPIGSNTPNIENQSIKNGVNNPVPFNKNSWESEGHKPTKLPPLQEALSGSSHKEDHMTLPPIRGTGLPPLVPSAPSVDSDKDQASLSRRASLFQVS
ncbi:hypothetical protein BsWGS_17432 [Bradybaena similaris]